MIFTETELKGAYLIDLEKLEDERGFFARAWCTDEFSKHGLNGQLMQCSISWNKQKGTLRGMHYQSHPFEETKVVRCSRGALYDVIVDLRPDSPTLGAHIAIELSQENRLMVYVPEGFAHGFQTLVDDTEVFYQISERYNPASARGVRYNDPFLGKIDWPVANPIVSERDLSFPDFGKI